MVGNFKSSKVSVVWRGKVRKRSNLDSGVNNLTTCVQSLKGASYFKYQGLWLFTLCYKSDLNLWKSHLTIRFIFTVPVYSDITKSELIRFKPSLSPSLGCLIPFVSLWFFCLKAWLWEAVIHLWLDLHDLKKKLNFISVPSNASRCHSVDFDLSVYLFISASASLWGSFTSTAPWGRVNGTWGREQTEPRLLHLQHHYPRLLTCFDLIPLCINPDL